MTPEEAQSELAVHRATIDEIDRGILELINRRTEVVGHIGRIKQEQNMAIYEPKREDEVFRNVTENNPGPLPSDAVRRVFERIMDEMRTVQRNRMLQGKQREQHVRRNG